MNLIRFGGVKIGEKFFEKLRENKRNPLSFSLRLFANLPRG
jgi:F0F1-type ATP synthase membrane subunit a